MTASLFAVRVQYLTSITVIENKMRLVKRMFPELVLNAARNDKSVHGQVRQNEMSKRRLPAVRISTVHVTGTRQGFPDVNQRCRPHAACVYRRH
jgi:hypothetical protein